MNDNQRPTSTDSPSMRTSPLLDPTVRLMILVLVLSVAGALWTVLG